MPERRKQTKKDKTTGQRKDAPKPKDREKRDQHDRKQGEKLQDYTG